MFIHCSALEQFTAFCASLCLLSLTTQEGDYFPFSQKTYNKHMLVKIKWDVLVQFFRLPPPNKSTMPPKKSSECRAVQSEKQFKNYPQQIAGVMKEDTQIKHFILHLATVAPAAIYHAMKSCPYCTVLYLSHPSAHSASGSRNMLPWWPWREPPYRLCAALLWWKTIQTSPFFCARHHVEKVSVIKNIEGCKAAAQSL